jgi:hypothetical protein
MSWTSIATITIGFFVGLATLLGVLWLGRRGSCLLASQHTLGRIVTNGCPEMTWGRTLKKALKCKGLLVNFMEWSTIPGDRSEWWSKTYSKPVPPSENWSHSVHGRKDEHCVICKRAPSPGRLGLENSSSFLLFVDVSLQLGIIIQSNLI